MHIMIPKSECRRITGRLTKFGFAQHYLILELLRFQHMNWISLYITQLTVMIIIIHYCMEKNKLEISSILHNECQL